MNILGRKISTNTKRLAEEIVDMSSKKINYYELTTKGKYGYVEHSSNCYNVYLSKQLDGEDFETNYLHEMRHIYQKEKGYPNVNSKSVFNEDEQNKVNDIRDRLDSHILDFDVNNWLLNNGYSIDCFLQKSLETILNSEFPETSYYNHAFIQIQLYSIYPYLTELDKIKLKSHIEGTEYIEVFNKLIKVNALELISSNSCAIAMCEIIDVLGLWNISKIKYRNNKIRTSNEYKTKKNELIK